MVLKGTGLKNQIILVGVTTFDLYGCVTLGKLLSIYK